MTKSEIAKAFEIAKSGKDLSDVDDSPLFGCALPEFDKVHCTLEQVAKLIRWQCQFMFGGWDMTEFDNCAHIAKKKFIIIG
jgi:hypothetical protein